MQHHKVLQEGPKIWNNTLQRGQGQTPVRKQPFPPQNRLHSPHQESLPSQSLWSLTPPLEPDLGAFLECGSSGGCSFTSWW